MSPISKVVTDEEQTISMRVIVVEKNSAAEPLARLAVFTRMYQ